MIKASQQGKTASVVAADRSRGGFVTGGDVLGSWAEKLSGRAGKRARGVLRFAFYGRVSTSPDPDRPKNTYVREDQILPYLAALAILLAGHAGRPVRGSRSRTQLTGPDGTAALIDQLRADGTVLTYDPDGRTLRAGGHDARRSPSARTP